MEGHTVERRVRLLLLACVLGLVLLWFGEKVLSLLISVQFDSGARSWFLTFCVDLTVYGLWTPFVVVLYYFGVGASIALASKKMVDAFIATAVSTFAYSAFAYENVKSYLWQPEGVDQVPRQGQVEFVIEQWLIVLFAASAGVVFALLARFLVGRWKIHRNRYTA